MEVDIIEVKKEYKNIAYYKLNNIHFLYFKIKKIVISCFWEFQGPIWKTPKIEIYKDDTKAIRIGWLWLAFGFGLRKLD